MNASGGGLSAVDVCHHAFAPEASALLPRSVPGTWDAGIVAHVAQFVERGLVPLAWHGRTVAASALSTFRRAPGPTPRCTRCEIGFVLSHGTRVVT